MNETLPNAAQAKAFFQKFRRPMSDDSVANARGGTPAKPHSTTIVTQVDQKDVQNKINNFVPMDKTVGSNSFRLKKLQNSPTNQSPDVLLKIQSLLPPPRVGSNKLTLVLDVDETLVHSSFMPQPGVQYDAQLTVTNDGKNYNVYVRFRPYLIEFLRFVSERFEVVIFTASLSVYCNALMDLLDPQGCLGNLRLFRQDCTYVDKSYVKDLFHLGRDLGRIAIVDNSPAAYIYQQRNAIPVTSWFDDPNDTVLRDLFGLLEELAQCQSVYEVLDRYNSHILMK